MVPWWVKIAIKAILARLPLSPRALRHAGFFDRGSTLDPDFAITVFRAHWARAEGLPQAFRYLEIGPGESIATAIIAWAFGASGGVLVDIGDFLVRDVDAYRGLIRRLEDVPGTCRDVRSLQSLTSFDALTKAISVELRFDGIRALERLPAESADLIVSQAALEHVALKDLPALVRELFRIQTSLGTGSHHIDFMDHLQFSLNHLRFAESLWERRGFANRSGFYTNRLRCSAIVELFQHAGFRAIVLERRVWNELPLPRAKMVRPFCLLSEEDLLTKEAIIVLKKSGPAPCVPSK